MISIKQRFFICAMSLTLILSGCQTQQKETQLPKVDVAILMPLTGKDAELGKRLTSFIQLGLEDGLAGQINLMTYDAADEAKARLAMDKVIAKKTKIVLGPLFSPTVSAITESAEANNITVITLSNNPALAGGNVYTFGHAPMKQTERLIDHFLARHHKDFVLMLPAGSYSKTVSSIIKDIAYRANANPVHIEFYEDSPEAIATSSENVSNLVDKINEMIEIDTKPVVYVADDTKNLHLIFSAFKKYDLDEKAIVVGDNRINIDFIDPIKLTYTGSLYYLNYNLDVKAREILGTHHLNFMDIMAYDLGRWLLII